MEARVPLPARMPAAKRATVQSMVEALLRTPRLVAIALGGSWARGTEREDSDVDLGLYYFEGDPLPLDSLRDVARLFDATGTPVVTEPYAWGEWINGGAWIRTAQGKVDLLYRNVDQVRRVIEAAKRGETVWDYAQTPVYGFHNVTYLGEAEVALALHDPEGIVADLGRRVSPYPPALARAVIQKSLWAAEFSLTFAALFASRGDVYNSVGSLTRILGCLTQALFAINRQYFLNDKGAIDAIEAFPARPPRYRERVSRILGRPGDSEATLRETVQALNGLFSEVVGLAGAAYRPRYSRRGDAEAPGGSP